MPQHTPTPRDAGRHTLANAARRYPVRQVITAVALMTAGSVIAGLQVVVFMIPAEVVPGGLSSVAVILNALFDTPVGLVILLGNIPIQYFGMRMLGGWRPVVATVYVVVVYSLAVEVFTYLDLGSVSDDRLLNVIFGGAMGGVAGGLIFSGGGTLGGTSTVSLILQNRMGTPMSTTFLYTDTAFIGLAVLVFGWESALYALLALVLNGMATDYILEGPSVIRTVTVITNHPDQISEMVIRDLNRSVTAWDAQGMYTHQQRAVLFVTVSRAQARQLKDKIVSIDPEAFVVVGQGHAAYGHGFREVQRNGSGRSRDQAGVVLSDVAESADGPPTLTVER